jgi:hypothetical protein
VHPEAARFAQEGIEFGEPGPGLLGLELQQPGADFTGIALSIEIHEFFRDGVVLQFALGFLARAALNVENRDQDIAIVQERRVEDAAQVAHQPGETLQARRGLPLDRGDFVHLLGSAEQRILDEAGLADRSKVAVATLSGGQAARLFIAALDLNREFPRFTNRSRASGVLGPSFL